MALRITRASTKKVMRADLYTDAMKEIGYKHGGVDEKPETLFDKITFDPKADQKAYATVFQNQNPERLVLTATKPAHPTIHPERSPFLP